MTQDSNPISGMMNRRAIRPSYRILKNDDDDDILHHKGVSLESVPLELLTPDVPGVVVFSE